MWINIRTMRINKRNKRIRISQFRILSHTVVMGVWAYLHICIVVSCNNEDGHLLDGGDPVPVVFSPAIGGKVNAQVSSRVADSNWSGTEAVGICMVDAAGNLPESAAFKLYQAEGAGRSVTLIPSNADNTLYYPPDGSNVYFYAFSPYTPPTSENRVSYSASDQSDQARLEAVDFVWAKSADTHNKTRPNVPLAFTHRQSRIIIKVIADDAADLGHPALTIKGMPPGGVYDLSDGSFTGVYAAAADITPCKVTAEETETGSVTWQAIVPPHTHADYGDRLFSFTFNGKDYTYTPNDDYVAEHSYTYELKLTASGLIVADGNTNCYIVAPGSTISFLATRAVTPGGAAADAAFTVRKLWDDTAGEAVTSCSVSGTGSDAVVTVVAGSNPGNAVIAVSVDEIIYWSWHIWVTDYNPNGEDAAFVNTLNTNNNGNPFVFMDRNLGATRAGTGYGSGTGLFYQWGRKDPFPATLNPGAAQPGGGSFTATKTTAALGTVENTIRKPNVFYMAVGESSSDWFYATRNDMLWGHGTVKTIYDPCPVGWRVPSYSVAAPSPSVETDSPWAGFASVNSGGKPDNLSGSFNNGYTWIAGSATTTYPAAGYRISKSCELIHVGLLGYYWSASRYEDGPGAASLYFNNGYVGVVYYGGRANGCSVRCVQE